MATKVFGLDLGTNSVGWAVVLNPDSPRPSVSAGAYVFPEPGEEDKGLFVSHRKRRGDKRRQRRNLRRKRQRRNSLMQILIANEMLPRSPQERFEFLTKTDPYSIRARGLDEQLSKMEFGRALYHICRRRGYLSTALLKLKGVPGMAEYEAYLAPDETESDELTEKTKEERGMLAQIAKLRKKLREENARTIGEFYYKKLQERIPVRLMGTSTLNPQKGDDDFARRRREFIDALGMRADRAMFEDEFEKLWTKQASYFEYPASLKAEIHNAIFHQRDLKPSNHAVGMCEFFPKRKRAARASFEFQRSQILQYLNTLSVIHDHEPARKLSAEEVKKLADRLEVTAEIPWEQAREIIALPEGWRFSDEPGGKKRGRTTRGRPSIKGNKTASAMRKALGDKWDQFTREQQQNLVHRLLTCRNLRDITRGLERDFGLTPGEVYCVATAELPEGYGMHSAKVLRMIEPFLLQGHVYSEALEKAGLREPNTSTEAKVEAVAEYAVAPTSINNPIVSRAVHKAIKVINALIAKYGRPDKIRLELPRDVSRTNKQRELLWKKQDKNNKERERAAKELEKYGLPVTEKNITKVRLWWEANCTSPYEPDKTVTLQQLIEDYEIDHIVPRSRCWDDSLGNRTICPMSMNLFKGDRTPYEMLKDDPDKWKKVRVHVSAMKKMSQRKRERILKEEWEEQEFTNNALSDTSYISREVKKALNPLGIPIEVTRGQLNAELRRQWELGSVLPLDEKDRADIESQRKKATLKKRSDHRHHALDAILTALTDTSTLQRLTRYYKEREFGKRRDMVPKRKPWPEIAEDLKMVIEAAPVVFEGTRGIVGPLHEETARKPPPKEQIDAAMAALPEHRRRRIKNCLVVGKQLVWLNEQGVAYKAYDLKSNHHCVIWEPVRPNKRGEFIREIEVVPMIEAAMRATCGEPIVRREREGYRFVMSLCKNDIVEYQSDEEPTLMRVAKFSESAGGGPDLWLARMTEARAKDSHRVRITGRAQLARILRRVILSPVGDEIGSEPPNAASGD